MPTSWQLHSSHAIIGLRSSSGASEQQLSAEHSHGPLACGLLMSAGLAAAEAEGGRERSVSKDTCAHFCRQPLSRDCISHCGDTTCAPAIAQIYADQMLLMHSSWCLIESAQLGLGSQPAVYSWYAASADWSAKMVTPAQDAHAHDWAGKWSTASCSARSVSANTDRCEM